MPAITHVHVCSNNAHYGTRLTFAHEWRVGPGSLGDGPVSRTRLAARLPLLVLVVVARTLLALIGSHVPERAWLAVSCADRQEALSRQQAHV